MAGGSVEYVMGNYNNTIGSSGFTTLPDRKYYDKYTTTNLRTACNGGICYGHGLSEVSNWYGDCFNLVNGSDPWFLRGGGYLGDSSTGTFYFDNSRGRAYDSWSARSVLVVGS
ncbi:unknown [Clostridium sp. CAG:914]|nr:unknown [Clostridium sp. CAG:914]